MANFEHSSSRSGFGPQRATVKWFNSTKGFGFVTLEDGSDAFCHASALASLPSAELPQGATVFCDVANGQRGMQVTNVHSVDLSTAESQPSRGGRFGGGGLGCRCRAPEPQRRTPRSLTPMGRGHGHFFTLAKALAIL